MYLQIQIFSFHSGTEYSEACYWFMAERFASSSALELLRCKAQDATWASDQQFPFTHVGTFAFLWFSIEGAWSQTTNLSITWQPLYLPQHVIYVLKNLALCSRGCLYLRHLTVLTVLKRLRLETSGFLWGLDVTEQCKLNTLVNKSNSCVSRGCQHSTERPPQRAVSSSSFFGKCLHHGPWVEHLPGPMEGMSKLIQFQKDVAGCMI